MKEVREKLGKILEENGKYEKVKGKVEEFIGKISKIEEGAKEAAKGATGDIAIGGATVAGQDAVPGETASVNALVKGIKEIVGVVLKATEGNAGATKTAYDEQKTIGGLFSGDKANDSSEAVAAAASATIGAVSGSDILQAIAKSGEVVDKNIEEATDAASIAVAKQDNAKKEIKAESAKKDAVIAGGIALRAMGKDGKFSAKAEVKVANAVNGAVSSAVNKVLSTLTVAIRNTVDLGLKEINRVLGEIKQGEGFESKAN
ncbi:Variable outer membrane protein (plasmid) [Borrelia crocidurae DOU]|uniref:Variable large protein n=1 Tax=Borrelia crocidurae DOU TaxID=1293575 RepID=W5SPA6_9SPIR|nr:Variable outer membrane protein [Borrelia crocidurae DOU]